MWWVGDWLLYGEGRKADWGQKYDEAIERTGLAYGTLRNTVFVAKRFSQLSRRRDKLSWAHHQEVAGLPTEKDQDKWLSRAEKEGWSEKELSRQIRQLTVCH
jgi:hypothetical protein